MRRVPFIAGILTWLAACMPVARADAPVPLEAFGRLPALEQVTVSPDGSRLAFVQTTGAGRVLTAYSFTERRTLAAFRLDDTKVRDVRWVTADVLLLTTSATAIPFELAGPRREWWLAQVCDVAASRCRPLTFEQRNEQTMNAILDVPEVRIVDGRAVLYVEGIYVTDVTLRALFRVDPVTGRAQIVARGNIDSEGWLVAADGRIAAAMEYSEREQRWTLRVRRGDELVAAAGGTAAIDAPSLVAFGLDGRSIVVEFFEDGVYAWRAYSPETGTWAELPDRQAAYGMPLRERTTQRLLGYQLRGVALARWFDAERQRRWESLARAFGDVRLRYESAADDFGRVAVHAFGADTPPGYHVLDWATRRADPIGPEYPGVARVGTIREIVYAAGDGLEIPALLTLPPGRDPKSLPLIVLPHGGPATVDTPEFDWWSQALAARGYAVLQPNFRGSTLDWAHQSAGFGQWGRKMQTDLSDGVAHLVKQGVVDPARVCIAGASYGGYAALAGVTLQSGIYRCAASVAGISDPGRFLAWSNYARGRGDRRSQRYWERFLGVSGMQDPLLASISPLARADAVSVPVLLIHGRDDTVVPFEQSDAMADALRRRRKPVEFVALKREDHWLSRADTRLQMLTTLVAFLEKHNAPY